MTYLHPEIDRRLSHVSTGWQWLRFLQRSAMLGSAVLLAALLVGTGMLLHWLADTWLVVAIYVAVALAALVTWLLIAILTADSPLKLNRLAAAVERVHAPLMDRLNTLVYLREKGGAIEQVLTKRIELQAREVMEQLPPPFPFPRMQALLHCGVFAALLIATILFYNHFQPWRQLQVTQQALAAAQQAEDPSLQIPPLEPPPQTAIEPPAEEQLWGEVRISQPGRDVRVTLLDIVPLQIEAAANRPLAKVEWFSAVNGGGEQSHALPTPEDPKYAVYNPEICVEDFGLVNWDVLRYYAVATTDDGQSYRSETYFVEVFPLLEELAKTPGGTEGNSYAALNEMTAMIERQQEVLRQTDRQLHLPPDQAVDRQQRLDALAREEVILADTAQHLAARTESQFGKSAVGSLGDRLRKSEDALRDAETALQENSENAETEVPKKQLAAFDRMIEARKHFQELLQKDPQAFENPPPNVADRRTPDLQKQLAATDQLQKGLQKQIDELSSVENNPGQFTPEQLEQSSRETKELVKELQKHAEPPSPPTPELRKAMNGETQEKMERQLERLVKAPTEEERRQAASLVKQDLEKLAEALSSDLESEMLERALDMQHEDIAQQLAEMQAREQRMQDAREFVKKALLKERTIERELNVNNAARRPKLADQQKQLNQSLDDFLKQHPEEFSEVQKECNAAQDAMSRAAGAMEAQQPNAQQQAGQAADRLQELDAALEYQSQQQRLADAYGLKEMLDQQIEQLGQMQKQPSSVSDQQQQQAAQDAKDVTDQLQQIARQSPTKECFGPALGNSLGDENKQQLDGAADQLAKAQSPSEKQQTAGKLGQALKKVSDAFADSQPRPQPGQNAGDDSSDRLREHGHQAISQGMRQLDSLARRQQSGQRLPQPAESQLRQEAATNLQEGIESVYGHNENSQQVVNKLRDDLKNPDYVIDVAELQKLVHDIQSLRRETATRATPDEDPDLFNIDPSRLPPAYRRSIEKYFQKLSEQP
jgi:hypothetical protein